MKEERIEAWRRTLIFATVGIAVGVFILHPAAMLVRDYHGSTSSFDWSALRMAFSSHHIHMAGFFGTLGVFVGALYGLLDVKLERHAQRIHVLEGMLPICCVCKRIRNEEPSRHGPPEWVQIEDYISSKSDATFTHGYCPKCHDEMMKEIEGRTERQQSSNSRAN